MTIAIRFFIMILLCIWTAEANGQYFEGEVDYNSYYLDKDNGQPMFEPKGETVTIKGSRYKIKLDNAQQGMLDWYIADYAKNVAYSRKNDSNSNIPNYSH